jgi:hypothetical protein
MTHLRSVVQLESDLTALRAAAERAGTALACLFSSSDEFEAAVVKVRREQGVYGPRRRRRRLLLAGLLTALLSVVFLIF